MEFVKYFFESNWYGVVICVEEGGGVIKGVLGDFEKVLDGFFRNCRFWVNFLF